MDILGLRYILVQLSGGDIYAHFISSSLSNGFIYFRN